MKDDRIFSNIQNRSIIFRFVKVLKVLTSPITSFDPCHGLVVVRPSTFGKGSLVRKGATQAEAISFFCKIVNVLTEKNVRCYVTYFTTFLYNLDFENLISRKPYPGKST
jgi:hypothetical protein